MVMIVSVGIASAAGNVVGNVVGQQLLKQETTQTTTTTNAGAPGENGTRTQGQRPSGNAGGFVGRAGGAFGFGQSSSEAKALEKLNIKTSATEILLLVAIAILINFISKKDTFCVFFYYLNRDNFSDEFMNFFNWFILTIH